MRWKTALAALLLAPALGAQEAPDVDFGPYDHFLESKGKAELRRKAIQLAQKLRGLYYACPQCKARGEILVVTRERYYDKWREEWIPDMKVESAARKAEVGCWADPD